MAEFVTAETGPRGGRMLPDGSRISPPPGGTGGGGVSPSPAAPGAHGWRNPKTRNYMIAGGVLVLIAAAVWYRKYKADSAAASSSDTSDSSDSDTDDADQTGDQYSDFDPWQQFGPGTNPQTATTSTTSPSDREKIADGYYLRGDEVPDGYHILSPQQLKTYKGPYFYFPKLPAKGAKGSPIRMGKTQLKAETPVYGTTLKGTLVSAPMPAGNGSGK